MNRNKTISNGTRIFNVIKVDFFQFSPLIVLYPYIAKKVNHIDIMTKTGVDIAANIPV